MNTVINISDLTATITSLTAVVISILSFFLSKQKATTESITINRMDWIKEVRELCSNFLTEFDKDLPDKSKLKELYIRIQLYGHGDTYEDLFSNLESCINFVEKSNKIIDSAVKAQLAKDVISEAQKILNGVWWRMKLESGISEKKDRNIKKLYDARYKEKES